MDNPGLYNVVEDKRNVLYNNGKAVSSSFNGIVDDFGLRIDGKVLKHDGITLAKSDYGSHLVQRLKAALFGDAVIASDSCVNITLSNYNKLLQGITVSGYSRYNRKLVYNIVSEPATADVVSFNRHGNRLVFSTGVTALSEDDMLYNNVSGTLTENVIDLEKTVYRTDCPFINLRHFNPIVTVGDGLVLHYYVDAKAMPLANSRTIGDTFTLHVKLSNGVEIKKTTYAGYNSVELPVFDTPGQLWFSVWCVDSNGVGSVEQHLDLLVKSASTPSIYEMTENDLEQYGIQPDNDDVDVAFNNKAALSNFFAAVKEGGYDGVKLLKHTYWIDIHAEFGTQTYYKCKVVNKVITEVTVVDESVVISHGSSHLKTDAPTVGSACDTTDEYYYYVVNTSTAGANIIFPDSFTVDLNESTIASVQFTDLRGGNIIVLNGFDSHVVNGNIVGSYDGFDFALSKIRVGGGTPAEHVHCIRFGEDAKFCSIENLDISQSLGYELGCNGNDWTHRAISISNDAENTAVDLSTGYVISCENMVTSSLIDVKVNLSTVDTINVGRTGLGSYMGGTQREMFISFYDENKDYISSVKTKMYYICKVPPSTQYARLTGYGTPSDWAYSTSSGIFGFHANPKTASDITIDNCYIHDTRTSGITLANGVGITITNCKWHNIALESGAYQVTKLLGDFEDGWQKLRRVSIVNCELDKGVGEETLVINYCNKLEFVHNKGISINNRGGIEDGFIEDCEIPNYTLGRNFRSMNPFVIYRDNIIGKLSISYDNSSTYNHTNEGDVNPYVTMEDTVIESPVDYGNLSLYGVSIANSELQQ